MSYNLVIPIIMSQHHVVSYNSYTVLKSKPKFLQWTFEHGWLNAEAIILVACRVVKSLQLF